MSYMWLCVLCVLCMSYHVIYIIYIAYSSLCYLCMYRTSVRRLYSTYVRVAGTRLPSPLPLSACVRVYACVLVPPNLYIHTYILSRWWLMGAP